MSLDPPTYLSSLQNNIRAVDKVRKEQRKQTVENDLDGYCTLFLGISGKPSILESAARRADVVQYTLVLLGDLLDGMYNLLCN
jgi:V-type H+-transporting ATPase subunit H